MLLEQPAGERVVRRDLRFAGRLVRVGGLRVGDACLDEGLADPLGQFAGRLVGEREAQHLLGGDLAGADQPDDARGHHRRLAGPGSGHDDLRGGRRGDAGRLLRGERDAEELLELLGIGDACCHSSEANGPL